ncbi:kinase-like domain-containing protein [Mycena crocata]|nr:kinase-like domain-containing protein [Mycena crocata]
MASEPVSEQRKNNVKRILTDVLGVDVNLSEVVHLDRGYNNYLYIVNVSGPVTSSTKSRHRQPGTLPLTVDTSRSIVVRLLKTELGAMPERVQNEVAALELARQPLTPVVRVPEVYAWSEGRGAEEIPFIIMELLPGIPLDSIWPGLDLPSRLPILRQIRDILLALRATPLPVLHTHAFGGLCFSASGSITTTLHPNGIGGPFVSAEAQWLSMLAQQIRTADENEFVKGWRGEEQPDFRSRLDSFLQNDDGFPALLRQVAAHSIFVHGDYNCRNLLVDPDTHLITGLLDFEFAWIGTSPEELMDGLEDFRQHTCVYSPPDGLAVHLLERSGWPCQAPESSALAAADLGCQTAKAWRDLAQLPIDDGYEATAKLYAFLEKICPWYFCQEPWCAAHDMVVERRVAGSALSEMLSSLGS